MVKEFKTFEELVYVLESRNVITDENTAPQIMRESYYAIVNGYKAPFLDTQAMKLTNEDVYHNGTRFEWIYALFSFDRDLRAITFKYLERAESIMKSAVVYAFCCKNHEPMSYLDISSYVGSQNMLLPKGYKGNRQSLHFRNLSHLMRILNSKVSNNSNKDFIKHYVKNYGFVPLWVLQNDLTFGNIAHFYQLQKRDVQNKTCKIILKATGKENMKLPYLTPTKLLHSFYVLVDFRNICAHGERLYCAKVGKSHDIGFNKMTASLALILSEKDIGAFYKEVSSLVSSYGSNLCSITAESLLNDMGFVR